MGLDMYLNAKRFVSEYDKDGVYEAANALSIKGKGDMKVNWITCKAMYWRKANQIHQWFVENVQDGVDDCKEYELSHENLNALLELCEKVLADKSLADDLLPSQGGFFFGSTEYDEGYFDDIQFTVDGLKELLSREGIDDWYFMYQASW